MTLEELKAFEKSHPQYAHLFPMLMKEFDAIAREEFGKAFRTINERAAQRAKETSGQHAVPEEDIKAVNEAFQAFLKQVNSDFMKNVEQQFARYQSM